MANRLEIHDELVLLSDLLANLLPVNPYQVPPGYFERLSNQVLNQLDAAVFPVLMSSPGSICCPYEVPENYFEGFTSSVLQRLSIDENKVVPTLPDLPANPYQVRAGYFDGLAEQIINRIRASEVATHVEELEILSPLLGNLNKPVPFILPEGYFNDFASDLVDGVQAVDFVNAELEEHSPMMMSARSKNVYDVPTDYFESLAENVSVKVSKSRNSTGLTRVMGTKAFRYAAAALIAGAVSLGALFLFEANQPGNLAAGSVTGMEKISNEEMTSYLEMAPVNEETNLEPFDLQETNVKELLADVSDKELEDYLYRQSSAKDLNN